MQDKIRTGYALHAEWPTRCSVLCFLFLLGELAVISLFWGAPFTLMNLRGSSGGFWGGWLDDHIFLGLACLVMSSVMSQRLYGKMNRGTMEPIYEVISRDCDPEQATEGLRWGLEQAKLRPLTRPELAYYAQLQIGYVQALVACRRLPEARRLLAEMDERQAVVKQLQANVALVEARMNGDARRFRELLAQSPRDVQESPLFQAQALMLEHREAEALPLLQGAGAPVPSMEVTRRYDLGLCFAALGDGESARRNMAWVAREGGTMPYRAEAESWLAANGAAAGEVQA